MDQNPKAFSRWLQVVDAVFNKWLVGTIAIVCFAISVSGFFNLDLFGFMRPANLNAIEILEWNRSQQVAATLGLLALLALFVSLSLSQHVFAIGERQKRLESEVGKFSEALRYRLDEQLDNIDANLDPTLSKIVGSYAKNLAKELRSTINEKKMVLRDLNEFRIFYKRALSVFPNSSICATSVASRRYFWNDPSINEAIQRFTENGGKMTRVFFLDDQEDLRAAEVREILNEQSRIGVNVFVVHKDNIPEEMRRLFVVDLTRPIAWEVHTPPGDIRIRDVTARVEPAVVNEYRELFERLQANPSVKQYHPRLASL